MAPSSNLLSTIQNEIEARIADLRPLLGEYEQLLAAVRALDAERPPARRRTNAARATRKPRASRGAAREAILAALEHGSHTVAELTIVTAMSAANVSGSVRRLLSEGAVWKTEREGKAAYALAGAEAQSA